MMSWALQLFEPVGWAEEVLDSAIEMGLPQLPRVYCAASLSSFVGAADRAAAYAQRAAALEADPRFDGFGAEWCRWLGAAGETHAGRLDAALSVVAGQPSVLDRCIELMELSAVGRGDEARQISETTMSSLRDRGNPLLYGYALIGYGRAFIDVDPPRALATFREGLDYSRRFRLLLVEGAIAYSAAVVESGHGDPGRALDLLDNALEAFQRRGVGSYRALSLAYLVVVLARSNQADVAATLYGGISDIPTIAIVPPLPGAVDELRTTLGPGLFDQYVAAGAAMEPGDAVAYARQQIRRLRSAGPGG